MRDRGEEQWTGKKSWPRPIKAERRQQLSLLPLPSLTAAAPATRMQWPPVAGGQGAGAESPPALSPQNCQNRLGDVASSDERDGPSATRDRGEEQRTNKEDPSSLLSCDAARLT